MNNTTINATKKIEELSNTIETYWQEFENYDYDEYICDIITSIADNNTSIYYSDIKEFMMNNFDAVEDAINEFGWDGCGSDLYKAGQMAEFLQLEHMMYNDLDTIIEILLIKYYVQTFDTLEIPEDIYNEIESASCRVDNNATIEDIIEEFNNAIA